MVNTTNRSLPPSFYRVQDEESFTFYNNKHGFVSQGHYLMDWAYWVNAKKIHEHLDWGHRSPEPSPFISVFDNEGKGIYHLLIGSRQASI